MKKTLAIMGALLCLLACNKETTETAVPETQGIKVNLTIKRADVFGTKGTVKDDWYEGDVVYVFFKGVSAPKYLELKLVDGAWQSTEKNGLTAADLDASGKMTAVFMPYGNDAKVAANTDGKCVFEDAEGDPFDYYGYFLMDQLSDYTYGEELEGTLELNVFHPINGYLVQFDVTGYTPGHEYVFYAEYVHRFRFEYYTPSDGYVTAWEDGSTKNEVKGYEDSVKGILSFSGALSATDPADYEFFVEDLTTGTVYTREVKSQPFPSSATIAISLGDLSSWSILEKVVKIVD